MYKSKHLANFRIKELTGAKYAVPNKSGKIIVS